MIVGKVQLSMGSLLDHSLMYMFCIFNLSDFFMQGFPQILFCFTHIFHNKLFCLFYFFMFLIINMEKDKQSRFIEPIRASIA
jgi:hypothetical protein